MKDTIAYLRYVGGSADEGVLLMDDVVSALRGYDEIIRYFLSHEDLALSNADFHLPVRIRQKCVEISIPETVQHWLLTGAGIALTAYISTMAKKSAEEGFGSTGTAKDIKSLFREAVKLAIQGVMLAKHVGTFTERTFQRVKFRNNNTEVGIINEQGECFYIPVKCLDIYKRCPKKMYSKISKPVNTDLSVELGVVQENGRVMKESISMQERDLFYFGDDEEDVVLPELKHGENVELEGEITRATESTQTIGLRYKGHTLTCRPDEGGLAFFKRQIISREDDHIYNVKVRVRGVVDRINLEGDSKKRPQIIFFEIVSLEESRNRDSLFRKIDL